MREFLTKGFFGAILGIVIGGAPADASLISRSFLDQALTDYATNTALDLKADNADLTNLSNKIGELPSDETVANMLSWQEAIGLPNYPFVSLLFNTNENSKNPKTVKEAIEVLFQCNSSPGSSGPCLPVMAGNIFSGQTLSDEILNSYELKNNYPGLTEYKGLLQLTADIGTLPSGSLLGNSLAMDALFKFTQGTDTPVFPNSLSDLIKQLYGSNEGLGAITALIKGFEFNFSDEYDSNVGIVPAMELGLSATQTAKTALATATEAKTAADANTAKIGTLPEGITVQGMYEGWTISNKITYSGLNKISSDYTALLNDFNTPSLYSLFAKGGTITIPGYSTNTILPLPELSYGVSKIGTLPSGEFPVFPESENIFSWLRQPLTYPTSLAELINAIYGNSETGGPGLLAAIIAGFPFDTDGDGITDSRVGAVTNFMLANDANNLANANTAKIGTVPDGKNLAGMISETDAKIGSWDAGNIAYGTSNPLFTAWAKFLPQISDPLQELYLSRPISLADLISKLYGRSSDEDFGILGYIGALLDVFDERITSQKAKIGTVPDGKNLAGMISETDAKIGDLPTEYTTVGAALTAMDAKIDARELPSSSDDGQYVLSAKKVGDTITYTWVRMDLTSEEQAQ